MAKLTYHIVVNWNASPDFVLDSIEAHSKLLQEGNDFVWYGKMVKTLPAIDIPARYLTRLREQITHGVESHLYLYCSNPLRERTLHVAKLEGIQKEFPAERICEHYHRVPYDVSYWFKVTDFREISYEHCQFLYSPVNKTIYDPVSNSKYPIVVTPTRPFRFFEYRTTRGTKWYQEQNLYNRTICCPRIDPRRIFVLMPFRDDFRDVYELGIKSAVELVATSSGEELECSRADEALDEPEIVKGVLEKIRNAGLIVADVTGNNPNVLFELGYAYAFNKSVVLITQDRTSVPFDIASRFSVHYTTKALTALRDNLRFAVEGQLTKKP